jgi:hypothetical protein
MNKGKTKGMNEGRYRRTEGTEGGTKNGMSEGRNKKTEGRKAK